MNQEVILQIRNLSKRIGGKTIIDNISFDVPKGEVFGFLGPNGAGKTTTIRMIVGLISISSGSIIVKGVDIRKNFEAAMNHIGAIVENPELYKFLTGYQNLVHFARMIPGITKERIAEVIKLVGLGNRIHDKVKTYSLGMRQRLGVAQAILHKPAILILDEPTNGLDPAGIRELRDYLRNLAQQEGTSVFVSSHLLSEMELMCDRVAIIQNGKLIDVRPIRDMVQGEDQVSAVLFELDRDEEGAAHIRSLLPEAQVQIVNQGIVAEMTREQIPQAVAGLASAGFKLYSVRSVNRSLEDKFLEMTRGGQIV